MGLVTLLTAAALLPIKPQSTGRQQNGAASASYDIFVRSSAVGGVEVDQRVVGWLAGRLLELVAEPLSSISEA